MTLFCLSTLHSLLSNIPFFVNKINIRNRLQVKFRTMADDEYALVSRGKLKLKTDSEVKKKKKKKNKKEKEKVERGAQEELESIKSTAEEHNFQTRHLTKAELSYKKMQEKMQEKRIMKKASLTNKQRVEKFNELLDSLTEHFDIPKVSWTK